MSLITLIADLLLVVRCWAWIRMTYYLLLLLDSYWRYQLLRNAVRFDSGRQMDYSDTTMYCASLETIYL